MDDRTGRQIVARRGEAATREMTGAVLMIAYSLVQTVSSQAAPIYIQPADFPGGTASQSAPSSPGPRYIGSDDFTLAQGATISGVRWQGAYSNPPIPGNITQFQLAIWSNNNGLPGNLLKTYVIPGNAGVAEGGIFPRCR